MNKMRFFDKTMKVLSIVGGSCFVLSMITLIIMLLTANFVRNENGVITEVIYQSIPQYIYSIFVFGNIFCLTWFAARAITYKLRKKECLQSQEESETLEQ